MKAIATFIILIQAFVLDGSSADKEARTWSDTSGKFSLQAAYISCEDYQVTLKKTSGESITIPVTRLCDQDQKYVETCVVETQKPPKEMADLLAYLEVCRDVAIKTLEKQKTEPDVESSNDGPAIDQETLDRYNDFRAKNPNYGLPQGFENQFGANSREMVESARAGAKQREIARVKAIEGAIKELKKALFIPTYSIRQFEEHLDSVSSLTHEKMFRDKGLNADADALRTAVQLNHKSVGYYKIRVQVHSVLDDKTAIVRARTGNDDDFDFTDVFCLECDTRPIRVDSEFELPNQLYFAKSLSKISYATGENTSVSNQTVLVLAPFPFSPKQLEEEFNRNKRTRATVFDPKREAASRLLKAKALLKSDKLNAVSQMKEIVAKFPGTAAATEATAGILTAQSQ